MENVVIAIKGVEGKWPHVLSTWAVLALDDVYSIAGASSQRPLTESGHFAVM